MKAAAWARPAVFGEFDGLTSALGILFALSAHPHLLMVTSVCSALAAVVGMASGEWLSDSEHGFTASLVIGGASGTGLLAPSVPYWFTSGAAAASASGAVVVVLVAGIAAVRSRGRGVRRSFAESYGIVVVTAAAVFAGQWLTQGATG